MCGIVGYVGFRRAADLIVEGLRRLEYRGYDSSGLATLGDEASIEILKAAGRLDQLESLVRPTPPDGSIAIGHTRWATHGAPTDANAHPHLGGSGSVAVVHNGIKS